jgi:hypothetical protein
MTEEKGLAGLAGWLRLIGFLAVAGPLYIIYMISTAYMDVFINGTWKQITSPEAPGYHPLLAPIFIADIIAIIVVLAMSAHAMNLYFQRSKRFPSLFIKINVVIIAAFIIKHVLLAIVFPPQYIIDSKFWVSLGAQLAVAALIFAYLLSSERVRLTFVKN